MPANDAFAMSNADDGYCPVCRSSLIWAECAACFGNGVFDSDALLEEDPLWYGPADCELCAECGGNGGDYVCDCSDIREAA